MLQDQKFFRDVVERTNYWTPSEEFEDTSGFSQELEEFLKHHLGETSLVGDSKELEVEEHDSGLEVDGKIFIFVEKNFSDQQEFSELIKEEISNFDYIVVVACGVEDPDEWRSLEMDYMGTRERKAQFEFIWKSRELYGTEREAEGRGEDPLGGLMDEVTENAGEDTSEDST